MNVGMAKLCNMWIIFSDFNKYNVIWIEIGGQVFCKIREWLRGVQGGNYLWVLIQPTFPNLITIEDKFYLCLSQWEPNHWIHVKG